MDRIQAFGKSFTAAIVPTVNRTQQMMKEQFGNVDDKTKLPDNYLELEKRVDALKQVHQKMLQVTSQYTHEAYDYPTNLRESFNDLGRTVTEKVSLLSTANSASEAAAAMTAPPSAKPQPKTFNHAIARASLASSQVLKTADHDGAKDDPLAGALEKYAIAEEKVGEARLAQDADVQARFLAGWSTTLNTQIQFATRARRGVESARLNLDATKAKYKNSGAFSFPGQGRDNLGEDEHLSEEARAEIEAKEDELLAQTEEAVGVMKNVLDTPEPLRNLAELIAAQLEYHKKAYEIMSELAPVVDQLQVEQEANYRKSREGA
ncbi:hypothetical protein BT63DRAFT_410181 [Microthyrium microscopicum]|uniref:BAR domain-containing protein n=1 Tax=Microthyrium microscopicum TaxID=703497 RepID=A0A6A6UN61_9PEZI|nr:hypothetical protein BT63DRAFT_410181 [Microthyrium microscopicum]